jgi:hypothetical protein
MKLTGALLLSAQLAAVQAQVNGTVYLQNSKWSFKAGVVDSAGVAWATFLVRALARMPVTSKICQILSDWIYLERHRIMDLLCAGYESNS